MRRRLTFSSSSLCNISRIDVFDDIVEKFIHLMVVVKYLFNIVIFVEKTGVKI